MEQIPVDTISGDSSASAVPELRDTLLGGECAAPPLEWRYGADFSAGGETAVTARGFVTVTPGEMFGRQSVPGTSAPAEPVPAPEYGSIETDRAAQLEILAVFAAYTVMLLLYRREIGSLFAGLFSSLHRQFVDRSYIFDIFINFATCLSFAAVGAGAVRIAAAALPDGAGMPWGMLVAAAVATVAAVTVLQFAVVYVSGLLVLQKDAARELLFIKKIYASIVAVAVTPAVFVFFPVAGGDVEVFLYIIGIEIVIISVMFLVRTFKFFVSQKISIFYWILYLCTVEALPFSIIAKIAHHGI